MRTRRIVPVLLALLIGAVIAPASPAAAAQPLFVDDDRQQCPQAEFQSIQAAVTAAQPEAVIMVCPGLYDERVTVPKTLTLRKRGRANGNFNSRETCFDPAPSAPDPERDAIVDGDPLTYTFSLQANAVVLQGFVVQGGRFGIETSEAFSGYVIEDNLVERNRRAIEFNANGELASEVVRNCVRLNNGGVLNEGAALRNAAIAHNAFTQQGESAIDVSGAGVRADLTIAHNDTLATPCGVCITSSTGSRVVHNDLRGDDFGILAGGNVGLEIAHNRLTDGFHGVLFAFAGFFPGAGTPNIDIDVSHNDISGMVRSGIRARTGSNLVSSRIARNRSTGNGQDGVRIETPGNVANLIDHNQLLDNAEHDCHDDTVGPGTAETVNRWSHNRGFTENRLGLCVVNQD